jgi:hypothetical protein
MNVPPLPETGIKSDFKRAVFKTIPPRPFYPRRPPLADLNLRYCLIANTLIGFNNLVSFSVNVYCDEVTLWNTLTNLTITGLEVFVVVWTYRSTKKAENSLEGSFYKLADQLENLELCPHNAPETALSKNNTYRLMANMIRRRSHPVGIRLKVWAYNLLHRESRKCSTCLQIQHAYRNDDCEFLVSKKKYKLENCPFCHWDY